MKDETVEESSENIQDVKPGEDIVKLNDYEQPSAISDQLAALPNSTEYGFVSYKIYDAYTDNPDATSDVLFDITANSNVAIQDSPVAGSPQSSANSGQIDAGESYSVTAIACDADGNRWFRVQVDGRTAWISEEALTSGDVSFKDSTDKTKYEDAINSDGYKIIEEDMLRQAAMLKTIMESIGKTNAGAVDQTDLDKLTRYTVGNKTYQLIIGATADTSRTYLNYANYMGSMNRIFGLPPQWSNFADPAISYNSVAIGRRYSQLILSNPTIVSLCPGTVKFSKSVVDNLSMIDFTSNMVDNIANQLSSNGVDMLWKFVERWDVQKGGYLDYVNAICRYAVQCMSTTEETALQSDTMGDEIDSRPLKDRPVPSVFLNGSTSSSSMPEYYVGTNDGTYATIDVSSLLGSTLESGVYNYASSSAYDDPDYQHRLIWYVWKTTEGIYDTVASALKSLGKAVTNANRYHFVHFAANGQANVRESFSTETRASALESSISGSITDMMKDISFILGTGIMDDADVAGDLQTLQSAINDSYGASFLNIFNVAMDVVSGGTVAWPQMIGNVSWGREYTFNVKFMTPYGDTESRFLNVILPYICLMCLWLPKQMDTAMDMYTWPFVVQAYAKGIFACPAGVLTNIEVSHGGGEETGWTGGGQQTEIDVSFSITPLHTKLSMSRNSPYFLKNVGLQNYMGTICGVDLTEPQEQLIKDSAAMIMGTWISELPARVEASIVSRIHDSRFAQLISFIVKNE